MHEPADDPIYTSSRREAITALIAWLCFGAYTLTYSFVSGYGRTPEELHYTWGIPSWVLYGVFLPWVAATVFAGWFALRFVRDGDLGPEGGAGAEGREGAVGDSPAGDSD